MLEVKNKKYLSVLDVSIEYDLKHQTIYNYWKQWKWKGFYFGSKLYFSEESIKQWAGSRLTEIYP